MEVMGTDITMIRGDTESLTVSMYNKHNEKIDFVDGDTVYFTVKNTVKSDKVILQKIVTEFTDGQALILFAPVDTDELRPLEYVYDVQLTRSDGTVTTIVDPESKFTIKGDVTRE